MNYYPHHIGDYTKDTAHLSMVEDGAYRRLIDLYYSTERPLPNDRAKLYRLVRAITKPERQITDAVLAEFFTLTDDGWRHKRCDAELARAQEKSNKAKASAASSWQSRRNANAHANASPDAQRTHSKGICGGNAPNSQEPIANSQSSAQPPVDNSTSAGRTSAALRALGVDVTPANPLLLAWVAAGVTEKQLAEAVERARLHKPKPTRVPAAYLDPIVREVIAGPTAPAARASPAWWTTEAETTAKGKELGLYPRGGESWDAFRGRIRAAINQGVANAS